MTQNKDSICWGCTKCTGKCSWSSIKHKPIKGWKAIKTKLNSYVDSYIVIKCPEFVSDGFKEIQSETLRNLLGLKKWAFEYISADNLKSLANKMGYKLIISIDESETYKSGKFKTQYFIGSKLC